MPDENDISENIFESAERIWAAGEHKPDDRVIFRRKFSFAEKQNPPNDAMLFVVCESAYNLYVNAKPVVLDGNLPRTPDKIYYDAVDIAPYLTKGNNVLVFYCRYTGDGAYEPGLTFACPALSELKVWSDPDTRAYRSGAYTNVHDPLTGGYSITYDAAREGQIDNVCLPAFESSLFAPTESFGQFATDEGVSLLPRPVPLFRFSKLLPAKRLNKTTEQNIEVYEAEIGGAGFILPRLEIAGAGGTEEITVKTDRFVCPANTEAGSFPVENTTLKYVCKNGKQAFDSPAVLSGTRIIVRMPKSVKLSGIYYYKSEYDFTYAGDFDCGDKEIDALLSKAETTVEACMRDTLYAAPDRDKKLLPAEASAVFAGALYTFDGDARKLSQKCVTDYLDNLEFFHESQGAFDNLLALSTRGLVASYAVTCGDLDRLINRLSVIAQYLDRFEICEGTLALDGIASVRACDGYRNVDAPVLYNAVYVSAADFLLRLCLKTGVSPEEVESVSAKAQEIRDAFGDKFRRPHGYASGEFYDERANAWTVIAGLGEPEMDSEIKKTLAVCQNATPRFETYIIEALFRLGAVKDALTRLKTRFHAAAQSENPTLYEGFFDDGAPCFAASAGYQYNFYRYIAGIKYGLNKISIRPCLTAFNEVKFSVAAGNDMIRGLYRADKKEIVIDVPADCPEAEIVLDPVWLGTEGSARVVKLNKGKNKFGL